MSIQHLGKTFEFLYEKKEDTLYLVDENGYQYSTNRYSKLKKRGELYRKVAHNVAFIASELAKGQRVG